MNLRSRHTFRPQKAYDRTLFLFGAIYKLRSHLHHSVTTLILNCKVSWVAGLLILNCKVRRVAGLTSHMTLSDMTTPPALTVSRENIKVQKLFEEPSYI